MAVPKKRKSKSKKNMRKAIWKQKPLKLVEKSLSLTKSLNSNKVMSFIDSTTLKEIKNESTHLGFLNFKK